jgi:hypothetical protein
MNIILSHCNEDLSWIKNIKEPEAKLYIYSKTNPDYNYIRRNKGCEASGYLKYIIDHYNDLADKNLFLHAHSNSYHQEYPSCHIINNLNWNLASFFSINRREWYFEQGINDYSDQARDYIWIRDNWNDVFGTELELPKSLHHYPSAQFQVDKELILQHSKAFYEHLYEWVMKTQLVNYINGRIFEHTWHYIFTLNPVELKYNKILIENNNK